jgi:hypothetical protein
VKLEAGDTSEAAQLLVAVFTSGGQLRSQNMHSRNAIWSLDPLWEHASFGRFRGSLCYLWIPQIYEFGGHTGQRVESRSRAVEFR